MSAKPLWGEFLWGVSRWGAPSAEALTPLELPSEVTERFRLPWWFMRDGPNEAFLATLWRTLKSSRFERAIAMIYLESALGSWLDTHGNLYGLERFRREGDLRYRQRILAEVKTPKSTFAAIETALDMVKNESSTVSIGPSAPARFSLDIASDGTDVNALITTLHRTRAAGYIPELQLSLDMTVPFTAKARGFYSLGNIAYYNAVHRYSGLIPFGPFLDPAYSYFDGSFTFGGERSYSLKDTLVEGEL